MDHVCSRDDVFRAADHGMDLYKKDGLSVSGKAGAEKGEAVAAPGRIQCLAMVKGRQNLELLFKVVAANNGIRLDNTAAAQATPEASRNGTTGAEAGREGTGS